MASRYPHLVQKDPQALLNALDRNFALVSEDIDKLQGSETPNAVKIAYATSNLTLTASFAEVPGAGVIVPLAGIYLVMGVFLFQESGGDTGNAFTGMLAVNGSLFSSSDKFAVLTAGASGDSATVAQNWVVNATRTNTRLSLQAKKAAGAGTSTCDALDTSIMALLVAPLSA